MRKAFLAVIILWLCPMLSAQTELSNDSVVKMVKAGLSAEIVVSMVNSQPGHYNVSADSLIALKKSGVGDTIISAMIAHSAGGGAPAAGGPAGATTATTSWSAAGGAAPASAPASGAAQALGANGLPPGIDSVGMYFKDKEGNWTELGAEVVNFKTGGALKHIGTAGIIKGDLNGYVAGFHSHQAMNMPAEFVLYVPEGRSPGEYQLLRFRINSDSREFRSLTGGVAHTKGGQVRDMVDFTSKKIAPRVYAITLGNDVGKGEYGFLPPQDGSGKNIESSGKIYTFSFAE
jgi:hypothetical protein